MNAFTTSRLLAARPVPGDVDHFIRMYQDPRVTATLGGVRSEEDSRRLFQANLDHWDQHGFGLWVFRAKTDNHFVGRAGLRRVTIDERDEVELAYALMAGDWNQGYATEMARAIVQIGFAQYGLNEIVSFTLPTNSRSRRVMEKSGFTYERDIVHANLPHVLYRLRESPLQRKSIS